MFRIPKALKEINKIQERLSKERKITDRDFIQKTRRSVEAIKQKFAIKATVAR